MKNEKASKKITVAPRQKSAKRTPSGLRNVVASSPRTSIAYSILSTVDWIKARLRALRTRKRQSRPAETTPSRADAAETRYRYQE